MMRITYDLKVDAKYVKLHEGAICETKEVTDGLHFDIDDTGKVLGIEILDASKNDFSIFTLNGDFDGLSINNVDSKSLTAILRNESEFLVSNEMEIS